MRKLVSLILVLCMLSSLSAGALAADVNAANLSDMVPRTYWSYDAVTAALDAGLIKPDGNSVRPYDKITRAEMATMVLAALGLNDSSGRDLKPFQADIGSFTDVHKNNRYYDNIAMAYRLKLLSGYGKSMAPDEAMTREQAFTVLCRLLDLDVKAADTAVLNRFSDKDKISSWARQSVAAMVAAGYVTGSAGILNPSGTITRQQCAQVLYNLFKRNYIGSQMTASALSGQSVTGNLIVTADNIMLANLNVNGDVIIGDGVGNGNVTLDHVTVNGRLIVRGGGSNSIYLKNSTAGAVIIEKLSDGGIRIHGDDGSSVDYVEVPDGKDSVIIECSVTDLTLSGDNLDVVVNGSVQTVSMTGDNISLSGKGSVDKVSLEEGVKKASITTAKTEVINNSKTAVTILGENGKSSTVASGSSIIANAGSSTSNPGSSNNPSVTQYKVSFHSNGGGTLNPLSIAEGKALGDLPVPTKDNMIFIGWFTDDVTFNNGVSADTKVFSNLELYACYLESAQMRETDEQTRTSVMDVTPDHQITVLSSDATMTADDVKAGLTLETITEDPSEFGGISVTGSAGTYIVSATGGYTEGCSYALTLNDEALTFENETGTVRTYNITVKLSAPILNLKLNSSIKSIPAGEISDITQNGQAVDSIFAPLYNIDGSSSVENIYGTFVYAGDENLAIGDQLAIYEGTPPDERDSTEDYTDQPISYVSVSGIEGDTISYGNTDTAEVIFTPDVLPVNEADDQDGDSSNASVTIAVSKMTYTDGDLEAMGLDSSTTVDSGDFLAFYTGDMANAGSLTYARIISVSVIGDDYVITFEDVSESEVMSSMNMSGSQDLNYDQLSKDIDLEDAEADIQEQVVASGYAQAAADYLVALAKADEDTRNQVCDMLGITNYSVAMLPGSMDILADATPKVNVRAQISKNLQHFKGDGLRAEVTVTCEVELGDDMKLEVSGTFVEEYKVTLSISSKTIWKWWFIFPYIDDFQVSANLDLYNYTYLSLNMSLFSEDEEWSDGLNIKDSIEELQDLTDSGGQANDKVQEFYALYKEMMSKNHDYFDLFSIKLCKITGGIDPLHILAYGLKVEFVVSLDADVALGTEFSYEKATRYNFTLKIKAKTSSTSQTDLVDEQYNFIAYAMGELGIRAGIRITVEVGLLDVSLDSVGISAEVGAYWKIWGFVYYQLQHKNNVTTSQSGGGCYMELGIYLTIKFLAQLGDGKLASYNKTLYDQSWPLWSAGSQYYTYDFGYKLTDNNDDILLKGRNATYPIPTSVYKMAQMDFKSGDVAVKSYDPNNYTFTIKNDPAHVFAVSNTGVISVTPPAKSDIATASLEVTWNTSPLSFTSAPISRTFNLTWDNLADSYVLSFNTNGGNNTGGIRAAYGKSISLPTPTRAGYTFSGWYTDNGTFNNAFTENKMPAFNYTLYAKWNVSTAGYTVRHYQQTLDGSGYTLIETENLTGTTGSNVTPALKSYTGFIPPALKTVTITGNGSTVAEYYYNRNSYTLTFKPNNGSNDIVSSLKYGAAITAPVVYKPGYSFTNWNSAVQAAMPAQNLTYTAQWSLNTYSITYDLAGGSIGVANPGTYTVQSAAITLTNPTKPGFVFAGWTGTGLTAATSTVTIQSGSTGNRYYTATWENAVNTSYSVHHLREDLSGDYSILETESRTGATGSATQAGARSYPGFTAGAVVQKTILADGSTVVEIRYSRNSYTLNFDANGGQGGTSGSVKYGAAIGAAIVTRAGYTFNGWDSEVAQTMPAADTTYMAQWTSNTYTVSFDKNAGDAAGSMEDQTFNYGTQQNLTANAYIRDGYAFTGWNTAADGSGTSYANNASVSNLTTEDNATVILYAKWTLSSGYGIFDAKYSAKYQVFDFPYYINGNSYDASWGFAGFSSGHQFSDAMLTGRYFTVRKTGDPTNPIALYMYEADGAPVVADTSPNLPASSLIGSESNVNLTNPCKTSLLNLYGSDWAKGLVAVGNITDLWAEGFMFTSANEFGYFVSGKVAYSGTGTFTLNHTFSNPTIDQINAVSDYQAGPLTTP